MTKSQENISQIEQNKVEVSKCNQLFHDDLFKRSLLKTACVGGAVATALYPLEVLQTRAQTKTLLHSQLNTMKASSFLLANYKTLLKGYLHANKQSFIKNFGLSNSSELLGENAKVKNNQINLGPVVGVSALIGSLDSLTNYFSNMRIMNALDKDPIFSMAQKLRFAKVGIGSRFLKNTTNAFFCISATTFLEEPINNVLPPAHYGVASKAGTTIIAGICGGLSTSFLDVINKNIVANTDLNLIKAPGMMKVTRELLSAGGTKALFRGSSWNVLATIIAYSVINGVDSLFENKADITYMTTNKSPQNLNLFKPKENQNTLKPEVDKNDPEIKSNIAITKTK